MKNRLLIIISVGLSMMLGACSNDTDIATVNGKDITASEFSHYLKFKRVPEKMTSSVKLRYSNTWSERQWRLSLTNLTCLIRA